MDIQLYVYDLSKVSYLNEALLALRITANHRGSQDKYSIETQSLEPLSLIYLY